jgi:hypothetical protein
MAQEWYYTQGDQKVGPVSVKELKQAAADGTLQPTDLVWTDGLKEWKEARTVKGLEGIWPSSPPSPPARRTAKPVAERPPSDADDQEDDEGRPAPTRSRASSNPSGLPEVTQQWWLIGLSLFCCFPVGLVFVWMHPRLTKSTKWTISGMVGVLFIGMMILGQIRQKAVNDSIADADRVWASGDKKGAVEKYRKLLDSGDDTFLTDEQKPLVYGRVIDYDAESGNAGSAVKLAEKALERSIEPSANQPAGQAAVAEAKRKKSTTGVDQKSNGQKSASDAKRDKADEIKSEYAGKFKPLAKDKLFSDLGRPDDIRRSNTKRNVCIYIWNLPDGGNFTASVIETVDGSEAVLIMGIQHERTPDEIDRLMRALENAGSR